VIPPLELSLRECVDLLSGGVVGRVAMATPRGPRIVPVNYAVHQDAIVFRTTPYSEMSTQGWDTELAFEVDHIDHETHQGWSVVALGRGHVVDDPEEIADIRGGPRPWAGGSRNLFVKLPWHTMTGRRIGHDWSPATLQPYRRVL
jgi:uncharacterized protein